MTTLGRELKKARIDADLTQQELGDKAGVPWVQISLIERDKANPRFQTVARLAQALGVSLERFVPVTPPDPQKE